MTEDTEKTEKIASAMPPLEEVTWYPCSSANPVFHLLTAAFGGIFSAIPFVMVVDNSAGVFVLFTAFFALAIPHILSKFAFPANVEKCFPHGVATMLLIGHVMAAYLFFMKTVFFGSTAFAAAVLILIPVFGRIAMIWFLKIRHAWAYTLVMLLVFCWIFSLFQPACMDLPLGAFLQNVRWNNGIAGVGMAVFFLRIPVCAVLAATVICAWSFRKVADRKGAAMATAMIAELAAWTAFLVTVQSLTFFPG